MIDKVPVAPPTAGPIRLVAVYRTVGALLRELSRALNQGQTLLKADSGLPAGTRKQNASLGSIQFLDASPRTLDSGPPSAPPAGALCHHSLPECSTGFPPPP
jgi:hypothetical protein